MKAIAFLWPHRPAATRPWKKAGSLPAGPDQEIGGLVAPDPPLFRKVFSRYCRLCVLDLERKIRPNVAEGVGDSELKCWPKL
jgi:hypothetical protein